MTPKFRVWDGEQMHEPPHGWVINCDGEVCFSTHDGPAPAEGFVALLYTGLDDAEGRPVYEGDICEYENYVLEMKQYRFVVGYDKGTLRWTRNHVDKHINSWPNLRHVSGGDCNLEVVGNRYENPDLLNEEAKPV